MTSLRRALAASAALALGLAGAVAIASPAAAANCEVTSTADTNSVGELRFEIESADSTPCTVITFSATFDTPQTITLDASLGAIDIPTTLDIQGPGSELLTVTRGADPTDYNIFEVDPTVVIDVVMSGMTISATPDANLGSGSAFQSIADLTRDLTFSDVVFENQVAQHGAGLDIQGTTGDLSFYDSEIVNNESESSGGGLYALGVAGTILLDGTRVDSNRAEGGPGGGIAINPEDVVNATTTDVIIQNGSLIEENFADEQGGGVFVNLGDDVTVTDSTFNDNESAIAGGGLFVTELTGDLTIARTDFTLNNAVTAGALATDIAGLVSISGSSFDSNFAGGAGAINAFNFSTLNIDSTLFEENTAGVGGALLLGGMQGGYGTVTITNSDFIENSTEGGVGGAIYGGGVDEPFTIARSNFLRNTTTEVQGSLSGSAVWFNNISSQVTVDSSTFAGNRLIGEISSQGVSLSVDFISSDEGAVLTVLNSTFDEDTTTEQSAVYIQDNQGSFSILYSTIVGAIPLVVDSGEVPLAQYIASTILQSGAGQLDVDSDTDPVDVEYSILSKAIDASEVNDLGHNQFATNALLGPLQNNGGRTDTRLPAANSPALSKGGPSLGAPSFDQRYTGFPRIVGTLDVGAVEIPAALAATGSTSLPLWVPIVGGIVLLLGIAAVVFSVLNRRRGGGAAVAGDSAEESGPGTGGDALFPEASTEPPTAEPPAENDPR